MSETIASIINNKNRVNKNRINNVINIANITNIIDFKDIMLLWLSSYKKNISNKTYNSYLEVISVNIAPELGNILKNQITGDIIQQFIDNSLEDYSFNSVQYFCKILNPSVRFGLKKGFLNRENFIDFSLETGKNQNPYTYHIYTQEDMEKILNVTYGWKRDIIILAYRTGMRKGELLGLKFEDIDFSEKFLQVKRTYSYVDGEGSTSKEVLKTIGSRRRVDLDSVCLAILANRKALSDSQFIFENPNTGKLYTAQAIIMKDICEKAGIEPRRFHDLRHTHASDLLALGVHPSIVQERLGHAKIQTTLDLYSHVIPTLQRETVDKYEKKHKLID